MKFTMVIADDEMVTLKGEELFIKKEFPDITIVGMATNGIELKQMLEELRPDIAVVDIRMPGLSGMEVIELLQHKNHWRTHYIINTAYSDFEYVKQALDLETGGYILKPGKREEWIATVERLCAAIVRERQEDQKRESFQSAIDVVSPVLGSEILQSVFMETVDEKAFTTYCSINNITFHKGCITIFLSDEKISLERKRLDQELKEGLNGLCEFLATVTDNGVVVMFFVPQELEENRQQAWCNELVFLITRRLEEAFHTGWTSRIGGIYGTFPEMRLSYRDCAAQFEQRRQGVREAPESGGVDKADFYVSKTKQYVDVYFQKDISLVECAADVGISPYYLSHIFKERTGQTFIEYLSEKRIEEAKLLALNERFTIKDIAERVGYLNTTYFCKVFKRVTGQTIGEYRKKNRRK